MNIPSAYELIKTESLPDIHAEGTLLRHKKSGAYVALAANDDTNKVFYIGFRTTPDDSTGKPHIIEHTVLCGSDKYPVKDPFVELVKGSLNTFLNAITYPDKTVYPLASTNDKDFANLMDVYLDAVFHPNIYKYKEIFQQEGWHYELDDPDGDITINGVVYNEMKGAFSSPDDVLEREILNSLFPHTTYAVESGGDPKDIPSLTYENYLDFHRRYYHPVNSMIYLYGKMDFTERLEYLDREYLSKYEAIDLDSSIAVEKPFAKPVEITGRYPVAAGEDTAHKTYLSENFVTGTALDQKLYQAFDILDYCLLSAPGAPLRQALIDAGIAEDITGGYQASTQQPYFSIIAKGSDIDKKDQFLQIIHDVFEEQAEKGLDKKMLLAAINSAEFKFREADFGSFPAGLIYGLDMLDSWNYDRNEPFLHMHPLEVLQELKKDAENGYFEDLIRKYFLNNTHASIVTVEPEPGLATKNADELKQQLADYKASLSKDEIDQLIADTKHLKEYQAAPSTQADLEKIPLLKRSDLTRDIKKFSNEEYEIDGVKALHHDVETNGIHYLSLMFDAGTVELSEVPAFAFALRLLGLLNTEHYSYKDFSTEMNLHTGGMAAEPTASRTTRNQKGYNFFAGVKAKFLFDETEKALELVDEMLFTSDFSDKKRIRDILLEEKSSIMQRFMTAGNAVASTRGMAHLSAASAIHDATGGVVYLRFLQDFADHFDEKIDGFIELADRLFKQVFTKKNLLISSIGRQRVADDDKKYMPEQIKKLYPDSSAPEVVIRPLEGAKREAITTAANVNYVSRSGDFAKAGYKYSGIMKIIQVAFSYDYLWINIRVKGGAYGCAGKFFRSGLMTLSTYRDPHVRESNEILKASDEYLRNFDVSERDMTKFIIGAVSGLDTPLTPSQEGTRSLSAYLSGVTEEMIQNERNAVIDATKEDIRTAADAVTAAMSDEIITVVGSEDAVKANKELFDSIEALN